MPARLLDGVATADRIRAEIVPRIAAFAARAHRPPGLGIVLVGENPASEIYVRGKVKSAGDLGIRVDLERLSASASIEDLLGLVGRLNRSDAHDGILVQSPLPSAMGADAERRVFDAIRPEKDVDGFHPINVGKLVQNRAALVACTPSGIVEGQYHHAPGVRLSDSLRNAATSERYIMLTDASLRLVGGDDVDASVRETPFILIASAHASVIVPLEDE